MSGLIFSVAALFYSAFEYRGSGAPQLFPYAVASADYSIPGIYINPSSLLSNRGVVIAVYGYRPYSECDIHSYMAGIRYSEDNWGTQFLWRSFGTGFYSENSFSLAAGVSLKKYIYGGVSFSEYFLSIDSDDQSFSKSLSDVDFSLTLAPFKWIDLSFLQINSSTYFSDKNSNTLYHEWSAGCLIKPASGFSLAYNITGTDIEKVSTYTASVVPAKFLFITGGYSSGCSQFAASFTLMLKNLNVSYGLSYHPYLGSSHSIGVAISTMNGPEILNYGNPLIRPVEKKININKSSEDEIRNLPTLSKKSSERLILYRKKIGNLTEKALLQLGLSDDEVEFIKFNTYGLERYNHQNDEHEKDLKKKKNSNQSKRFMPQKERVKNRFRKMLKIGLPAYTAIRYSELVEKSEFDEIESIVAADRTLTDEQKKGVLDICSE